MDSNGNVFALRAVRTVVAVRQRIGLFPLIRIQLQDFSAQEKTMVMIITQWHSSLRIQKMIAIRIHPIMKNSV